MATQWTRYARNEQGERQPIQITHYTVAETARLVRPALAAAFPGVKFGVTSKSYSGGASITVTWQDGPTHDAVKAVVRRFEGSDFDGMTDLKSYRDTVDAEGNPCHYGADMIHCNRVYSQAFMQRIVDFVCGRFGVEAPAVMVTGGKSADAYPEWNWALRGNEPRIGEEWVTHYISRLAQRTSGDAEELTLYP